VANARTWLPRGLALLAFALFAWLAPSGMYWLDSSELSAASVSLGAPHPTGFPLYCLVGKAMSLLPIGEIAFRYHLLSAASAALAVLAVCRLVDGAGDHDAASLAGGLVAGALCAVTLGFARQATAAEVYAPNALVLAVALVFFARVARGGGARDGLALAWIAGLGLGMHTTFRALLAVPIIALLAVRLYRGARWPLYAPLIALTVGVALHLYFPVRSATGRTAETDWGHPRTAAALVDYVSAKSIRVSLAGEIMSHEPMVIAADARRFGGEMGDQLGALALVAALGGAVVLFRERRGRWLGAALMVVAVGDAAFSIWVHPIGIEDLQNGLPLTVAVATLAGLGVAALGRSLGRAAPFATGAVGAMLLVGPALVSLPSVAAARLGDLPRQAAEDALAAAPPRALLLVRSDSLAAGLMYLTVVEGARPDVAWLVRQLLPDWPHTDAALARAGVSQTIDRERPLASLLSLGRPVGWELEDDAPPRGLTVSADVPVAGLVTGAPPAGDIARAAARLEAFYAGDGGDDRIALRLAADRPRRGALTHGRSGRRRRRHRAGAGAVAQPGHRPGQRGPLPPGARRHEPGPGAG
jgi:hypothetical protein